jgi:hypothetical protein
MSIALPGITASAVRSFQPEQQSVFSQAFARLAAAIRSRDPRAAQQAFAALTIAEPRSGAEHEFPAWAGTGPNWASFAKRQHQRFATIDEQDEDVRSSDRAALVARQAS